MTTPTECVNCHASTLSWKEEKWGYTLYECGSCKLQFWWPFKNPGADAYENNGRFQARNNHPLGKSLYQQQKLFLDAYQKPGSTLLDLGIGTGRFLAAAKERGYQVTGTDFDSKAVAAAKNVLGLDDVYAMDVETFLKTYPQRKFSIITMFEVLEHVDSYSFLPYVRNALETGGYFVISVPNRECWRALLTNEGPPVHLSRWSAASMKLFLDHHGFRVVSIRKIPVRFDLIITRFNEWTKGFLSFSLVKKIESLTVAGEEKATPQGPVAPRKATFTMHIVRALALVKMYVFFFIPASCIYAYLWLTGRQYQTLYVTATPK